MSNKHGIVSSIGRDKSSTILLPLAKFKKRRNSSNKDAAMSRCQSTPGLVESEGRTTLEDMWLPPNSPPVCHQLSGSLGRSVTPSTQTSDDQQHNGLEEAAKQYQRSHNGDESGEFSFHLESGNDEIFSNFASQELLEDEIKILRSRLRTIETENLILNTRLSKQQWNLENRLAEIEMQIRGQSSLSSLDQANETDEIDCNQESII